jgi:hypothetical protein
MYHARLGELTEAKACFDRAAKWLQESKSLNAIEAAELKQLRGEAERALTGKAFQEK